MKLSAALSILFDLKFGVQVSILPTLRAIWATPGLLLRPRAISRIIMAHIWRSDFGDGTDANAREVKERLITPNASGVVLDLGAGHGHTAKYLDRDRVKKYIALEPNPDMHSYIRRAAAASGFTEEAGNFILLGCGAEDLTYILQRIPPRSADTIVCVLTMCSFPANPSPQVVLHTLVDGVLASGGQLLMYEHVLSPRADVAWWQRLWTPIFARVFDGCRLDRPTLVWVKEMGGWKVEEVWGKEGEPEEHLFWHQIGRFVKE